MSLISFKEELAKASQARYAIPLYDVFDGYGVDGMIIASEAKKAPGIIGIYTGALKQENSEAFVAYSIVRAKCSSVPFSIYLDHGDSVETCLRAIDLGFNDVMYDGSKLPLEENIANTRKVVEVAHAKGVGVEAELGHVGTGSDYDTFGAQRLGFTDPDVVDYFIKETGVDFLAIAFGNAHGNYKGEPHLDIDLVRTIRSRVSIPLVMHGGTGLTDPVYREIVAAGIAKINYFTGIANEVTKHMVEMANVPEPSMMAMLAEVTSTYTEVCGHYYDVFGTSGRC
jgi:fructose-bisphosphate aldolase, class II